MASVSLHRATYILERGVWYATCRACGWNTSDVLRRRARSSFLIHIQERREAESSGVDPFDSSRLPTSGAPELEEVLDFRESALTSVPGQTNAELSSAEPLSE